MIKLRLDSFSKKKKKKKKKKKVFEIVDCFSSEEEQRTR